MNAIEVAVKLLVALLTIAIAYAAVLPSYDFLIHFETHILGFFVASITVLVFIFVMISPNWISACAKGLLVVSFVLALNFWIDLYQVYNLPNAKTDAWAENSAIKLHSVFILVGAIALGLCGSIVLMLSKDDFRYKANGRRDFKIRKF